MKACFASEMRGVDKAASEIGGIPSIVLMENAAMACVEELKNDFANLSEKSVAVFCGKGNNGGLQSQDICTIWALMWRFIWYAEMNLKATQKLILI